jgi:hypothetical protein
MRRLRVWIAALGSAWSQLWQTIWGGLLFLIDAAPPPDPDETVSAVVGRRAADGARWARVAAAVIDVLMFGLDGFRWGHCRRAAAAHAKT